MKQRYSLRSSRAVLKSLEDYSDEDVSESGDLEVDKDEFFVSDIESIEQESNEQCTKEQGILCIRCKRCSMR